MSVARESARGSRDSRSGYTAPSGSFSTRRIARWTPLRRLDGLGALGPFLRHDLPNVRNHFAGFFENDRVADDADRAAESDRRCAAWRWRPWCRRETPAPAGPPASGVPDFPTVQSTSRTTVCVCSAAYLNAMTQRGALLVAPSVRAAPANRPSRPSRPSDTSISREFRRTFRSPRLLHRRSWPTLRCSPMGNPHVFE